MSAPQPVPPQQPQAPQPIIINNNVAASASAAAFAGGYGRRRQSAKVHVVLFLFTGGIGNIAYAWYISDWNKKRGL
ncbi:hypothetical protein [Streptomyces sp. BK239]|uniref:hypothetical protein n=1 Tax=Streptomyces sp. BK239 TaxID=2512155 RepID=UPI00102B87E3|nr:hypothetical protein [Streptomyces sp. BK239]RZU21781.1 hypothetical protein EV567_2288 [Streptomyces sp. BK239]